MSDKKHIDRVFQEKLKDFEATPNAKVWEGIQNTLNDQEGHNKKVFPIWLKYAGIAAALLLLLTVGNLLFNSTEIDTPIKIVDSENVNSSQTATGSDNSVSSNVDGSVISGLENSSATTSNENLEEKSAMAKNNDDDSNENLITESSSNKNRPFSSSKNNTVVINDSDANKNITNSSSKFNKEKEVASENSFNQDKTSTKEKKNNSPLQSNKTKDNINNSSYGLASNQTNTNDENVSNQINNNMSSEKDTNPKFNANDALIAMKENTGLVNNEDTIEKENTKEEETKKDSTSIEEAIAKVEDLIEKEEEKVNRWQVYANIAPVYYNTLGNGSHIHDQFVNNPKTGEVNTSYGVNVGYALNEKLTLRTGLNSLNLSYDTDNVILYESVSNSPDTTSPLRNITFAPSAGNISILSASNVGVQQIDGILGNNYNAAISQRISYYEVPLELQYGIVNKNFGVNIIAGFSTFFLDGNEVYSEFDDRKIYIGEANNINNVSFSTNIGLGLNYKFTEKLKFNLEPTFKYQLNAFKETSGNFKPYIIGVYTGFSYKF